MIIEQNATQFGPSSKVRIQSLLARDCTVTEMRAKMGGMSRRCLREAHFLRQRAAANREVATQLSLAASRVATIERVHRRLHSYDGTSTVALKQYLEEFCRDFSTIDLSDDGVKIRVEANEIEIPTNKAIPSDS